MAAPGLLRSLLFTVTTRIRFQPELPVIEFASVVNENRASEVVGVLVSRSHLYETNDDKVTNHARPVDPDQFSSFLARPTLPYLIVPTRYGQSQNSLKRLH